MPSSGIGRVLFGGAHNLQTTPPHDRQWCRRNSSVKPRWHIWQCSAALSGTQVLASRFGRRWDRSVATSKPSGSAGGGSRPSSRAASCSRYKALPSCAYHAAAPAGVSSPRKPSSAALPPPSRAASCSRVQLSRVRLRTKVICVPAERSGGCFGERYSTPPPTIDRREPRHWPRARWKPLH